MGSAGELIFLCKKWPKKWPKMAKKNLLMVYIASEWPVDRFTKELFFNFGGSRPFLMEDFIALPIPKKIFVQMLPITLVLELIFLIG